MVRDVGIARWRLRSQHLVEPHLATTVDVVGALLAVQAENPSQSAWAVAARTAEPDRADLARCSRRHGGAHARVAPDLALRPHHDIGWLTELTAPRVRLSTQQQLRVVHGMDDRAIDTVSTAVLDALESSHLTRVELAGVLADTGHELTGQALMILLAELELQALVCSGRPAGGRHPHLRPVRRPGPVPRQLDHDEALAELALRYFTGHGPATERDLSYWATLRLGDVRAGLAQVSDQLASFEHDGRTFWHAPADGPTAPGSPTGHLLQILDETYRGYQDSRWVLWTRSTRPPNGTASTACSSSTGSPGCGGRSISLKDVVDGGDQRTPGPPRSERGRCRDDVQRPPQPDHAATSPTRSGTIRSCTPHSNAVGTVTTRRPVSATALGVPRDQPPHGALRLRRRTHVNV